MSWKPNLETLGVVGGVGGARGVALPSSLTSGGGVGGARFSSQVTSDTLQPPKRSHHVTSKRVRKVQRIPDTGGSAGAPLLSSTASYGGAREAWGASNKGSSRPGQCLFKGGEPRNYPFLSCVSPFLDFRKR